MTRRTVKWIVIAVLAFVLASLAALWSYGRFAERVRGPASQALPVEAAATPVDRAIAPLLDAQPGQTGMVLLSDNVDAFAARATLARSAGRSLDLQYYMWHPDFTGNLLYDEVLRAADRGVRVRLLLDDLNVHGSRDVLAALDSHPRIEVRMFNPTRAREGSFMRGVEMLLRWLSVNRRMHNKAWIVDGRVAIVGGRNVGDEYFDAARDTNFMDTDVAVLGDAVGEASRQFDAYWNSPNAVPLSALVRHPKASLGDVRKTLGTGLASPSAQPYLRKLAQSPSVRSLVTGQRTIHWSRAAHIVSDPPEKAAGAPPSPEWLTPVLVHDMTRARHQLLLISPYFVPGDAGVRALRDLRRRGVEVGVLTNSLAANDVVAVHGGYAGYRAPLLRQGIGLYELKAQGKPDGSLFGSSGASLHTKAFVVDGRTGFIGSFNLDPRSMNLNTEMGLLFVQPDLARELQQLYARKTAPAVSYRLALVDGALRWHDDAAQPPHTWTREPDASPWRRGAAKVIGWLPVESQL
ncbi:cardiolipin synthase [Stenotrophomonas panacihumi]|uniref:Cardiolipin synthase n=1 Tax=Stenotrophomonas panacihumi TaxID=676599 RepID=A0A0R0AWF1_9GAMM|nr:phospholipase D family protein [Stenotrophomonas panacihumi]KRG49285.1 cardiolipin synthase [Stenotrophomonas panacihumi]PTN53948.1 phospholipase D family protein [Stenotrophomonas panacihumi]